MSRISLLFQLTLIILCVSTVLMCQGKEKVKKLEENVENLENERRKDKEKVEKLEEENRKKEEKIENLIEKFENLEEENRKKEEKFENLIEKFENLEAVIAEKKPPTLKCENIKKTVNSEPFKMTTNHLPFTCVYKNNILPLKYQWPVNGTPLLEGNHHGLVLCTNGAYDFCKYNIEVKVRRCERLRNYDEHGRYDCDHHVKAPSVGSKCTFSCNENYDVVSPSIITCQQNGETGKWSTDNRPKCKVKTCRKGNLPKTALNITCTEDTPNAYGSVCWPICDKSNGFSNVGSYTKCKDGTWTVPWNSLNCEDTKRPQITNCPGSIKYLRIKDENITEVKWPELHAKDNDDNLKWKFSSSDINRHGGLFPDGWSSVKISVADSAGNEAEPCVFFVNVEVKKCPPPRIKDKYVQSKCSPPFIVGSVCEFDCRLSIQLKGENFGTCVWSGERAYWHFGPVANTSEPEPTCKIPKCVKLTSPINGALTCDKWYGGSICQMMCSDGYDFTMAVQAMMPLYRCSMTTGKWLPDTILEKCEPAEEGIHVFPYHFYFFGRCVHVLEEIKETFIEHLNRDECPQKDCKTTNVEVLCGKEVDEFEDADDNVYRGKRSSPSGRWRSNIRYRGRTRPSKKMNGGRTRYSKRYRARYKMRQTLRRRKQKPPHYVKVSIKLESTTNMEKQSKDVESIVVFLSGVTIKVNGRTIRMTKAIKGRPSVICSAGKKPGFFNRKHCVPCPAGTFYDLTRKECVYCPYGQFQNETGQFSCHLCHQGSTTLELGNKNASRCINMCPTGEYSENGVIPCTPCPFGSYQNSVNGKTCIPCLFGMTTEVMGSNSPNACVPFDLMLTGPTILPIVSSDNHIINDFTMAFWTKVLDPSHGGLKLSFSDTASVNDEVFSIFVNSTLSIYVHQRLVASFKDAIEEKWNHLAFTWNYPYMSVFLNGAQLFNESCEFLPESFIPANSHMRLSVRQGAYVFLKNLLVHRSKLPVMTLSSNCHSGNDSLFALEWETEVKNVVAVIPSSCMEKNMCDDEPCGDNICIPTRQGHTCVCRYGYSGPYCTIPPDRCRNFPCKNNGTCFVSSTGSFECACPPKYRGKFCSDKIADGSWGTWMSWSSCSVTCGFGTMSRKRFCDDPPPDFGGKQCEGPAFENKGCKQKTCPECKSSDLIVGKGIIPFCEEVNDQINCSLKCKEGSVFPVEPFNYLCIDGIWIPSKDTLSCTEPVSPSEVGIQYTVTYNTEVVSLDDIFTKLNEIGKQVQINSSTESRPISYTVTHSNYGGTLLLKTDLPEGNLSIDFLEKDKRARKFMSPLLDSWDWLSETALLENSEDRDLIISTTNETVSVYPHGRTDMSVPMQGQFGEILKNWYYLDKVNSDLKKNEFHQFRLPVNQSDGNLFEPTSLSLSQVMNCPKGAVRGSLFCVKCPPGLFYSKKRCELCPRGYYQNRAGEDRCNSCKGFSWTHLTRMTDENECSGDEVVGDYLLVSTVKGQIVKIKLEDMESETFNVSYGNPEHLAYSAASDIFYFSTKQPTTLARMNMNGSDEEIVYIFDEDTSITGLAVDKPTGLIFFTTYDGFLGAFNVQHKAIYPLLNNLTKPTGLIVDSEEMEIYWSEGRYVKKLNYRAERIRVIVSDIDRVLSPKLRLTGKSILWYSRRRLRGSDRDGNMNQTLETGFTRNFGETSRYYFYIDEQSNIWRKNKDHYASTIVTTLQTDILNIEQVGIEKSKGTNGCTSLNGGCEQGCFPLTRTLRKCFCADGFTLKYDGKTCRKDMSSHFETKDSKYWYYPEPSQYSLPPAKEVKLSVKACYAALKLGELKRSRFYKISLTEVNGNRTEMTVRKCKTSSLCPLLRKKTGNFLHCDEFRPFWISWKHKMLSIGTGLDVGKMILLESKDINPFAIRQIGFTTLGNTTAAWNV